MWKGMYREVVGGIVEMFIAANALILLWNDSIRTHVVFFSRGKGEVGDKWENTLTTDTVGLVLYIAPLRTFTPTVLKPPPPRFLALSGCSRSVAYLLHASGELPRQPTEVKPGEE